MGKKRFARLEFGGKRIDIQLSEKSAGIESWQRKCSTCGRVIAKSGNCFYCGLDSNEFVKKDTDTSADAAKRDQLFESGESRVTIDGRTFLSSDRDLPIDVQELMLRLKNEGYSEELVRDWMKRNDLRPRRANFFDNWVEAIERRFGRVLRSNVFFFVLLFILFCFLIFVLRHRW
ncbi:MAG: hypothetical protein PHR74_05965 [Candidatus Omnitrophica bacterium]|jgi:hypothetical protein|nr:hypothetical protein [Candidatus Omnitrophota bacterium]